VFAPEGDSLETLVAVLNTSFWLGTHVLCITAGYGLCLLTAGAAHLWLFRRGGDGALFRLMHRLSLAALLLTATGTALGGIWADQSWGRFWGWDPKENGALLIVLWLAWLQHGRVGALMSETAYASGMAALAVVVALSWFGVNLLGVGLHSYGFTSGIASGLAAFCAAELLAIGWLWHRRARHEAA
jgi:ABC-type transport system involved in cytochrome c biogenesis permease subunit